MAIHKNSGYSDDPKSNGFLEFGADSGEEFGQEMQRRMGLRQTATGPPIATSQPIPVAAPAQAAPVPQAAPAQPAPAAQTPAASPPPPPPAQAPAAQAAPAAILTAPAPAPTPVLPPPPPAMAGGAGWLVSGPGALNPNLGKDIPRASMQALAAIGAKGAY